MHIRKKEKDIKDEREKKNKDSEKMCVLLPSLCDFHWLPSAPNSRTNLL
jgi:hypothetical protein